LILKGRKEWMLEVKEMDKAARNQEQSNYFSFFIYLQQFFTLLLLIIKLIQTSNFYKNMPIL